MCPKGGFYNEFVKLFGGKSQEDKDAESMKNNLEIALAAYREQSQIAADAYIRAAELSASGMIEAANIAAEESRAAREAALAYMKEATAQAQGYLDTTLGATAPIIIEGQMMSLGILKEFGDQSAALYEPYIGAGKEALSKYQELANQGVTLSRGQMVQVGDKSVEAPYDITKSPYYGLYEWQQKQQEKSINQALGSRGLSNSGYGITEQVKADTGLSESLAATEYQRAVDDYLRSMDSQGKLMGIGYEASGNLAAIKSTQGANMANVVQSGMGSLANLFSQVGTAKANAAMGQGTSLANISMQSGSQLANIASQLGTNLGNVYMQSGAGQANAANNLSNNMASMYTSYGNNLANLYSQNSKNQQAMIAGMGKSGMGLLQSWMNNQNNRGSGNNYSWSGDESDTWSGGGGSDWGESYYDGGEDYGFM